MQQVAGEVNAFSSLSLLEKRAELGLAGRRWTEDRFNFDKYIQTWDDLFTSIYDEKGSWDDRKGYKSYEVKVF